jgi:hypothetical protein
MAGKNLISARVRVVWALLPAAILAASGLAHGQESTRPGCVTRFDNGKPYLFCEGEDEYKRMQAPIQRNEAVVPLPGSMPEFDRASPSVSPARPWSTAPMGGAMRPAPPTKATAPTVGAPAGGGGGGGGGGGAVKSTVGSRPSAAPVARPSAAAPPSVRLQAVRALIEPAEMPPREVAGYGVVAFTTLPVSHDLERYKTVCEAYKATLMSQAELPPNTPLSAQMVTYWPIGKKNTPEAQRADCPHLVSNYALRLGLDAIADADKKKEGFANRRGPFLIAWAPSESRLVPDAVVLVMDLSQLDTQRSFVEVFQDWRQHITDNPELWQRGGFDVDAVRRIIRDTFDHYGDGLLRLITSKT